MYAHVCVPAHRHQRSTYNYLPLSISIFCMCVCKMCFYCMMCVYMCVYVGHAQACDCRHVHAEVRHLECRSIPSTLFKSGPSLFYIYRVIYTCSWTSEDNMQELVLFCHEFHGLSSGRQAWRSGPLPTEPSDQPSSLVCHCVHQVRQPTRFRGSFCFPSQEQCGYTTDL